MIDDKYLLRRILGFIDNGRDYKAVCLVSRGWYRILQDLFPKGGKFINHLVTLFEKLPDKEWNYKWLSQNPNVTWEYIQANPDKPWDYTYLSGNPNITWEMVIANPGKLWSYFVLSENPNI